MARGAHRGRGAAGSIRSLVSAQIGLHACACVPRFRRPRLLRDVVPYALLHDHARGAFDTWPGRWRRQGDSPLGPPCNAACAPPLLYSTLFACDQGREKERVCVAAQPTRMPSECPCARDNTHSALPPALCGETCADGCDVWPFEMIDVVSCGHCGASSLSMRMDVVMTTRVAEITGGWRYITSCCRIDCGLGRGRPVVWLVTEM
jgi:hypothetical protein